MFTFRTPGGRPATQTEDASREMATANHITDGENSSHQAEMSNDDVDLSRSSTESGIHISIRYLLEDILHLQLHEYEAFIRACDIGHSPELVLRFTRFSLQEIISQWDFTTEFVLMHRGLLERLWGFGAVWASDYDFSKLRTCQLYAVECIETSAMVSPFLKVQFTAMALRLETEFASFTRHRILGGQQGSVTPAAEPESGGSLPQRHTTGFHQDSTTHTRHGGQQGSIASSASVASTSASLDPQEEHSDPGEEHHYANGTGEHCYAQLEAIERLKQRCVEETVAPFLPSPRDNAGHPSSARPMVGRGFGRGGTIDIGFDISRSSTSPRLPHTPSVGGPFGNTISSTPPKQGSNRHDSTSVSSGVTNTPPPPGEKTVQFNTDGMRVYLQELRIKNQRIVPHTMFPDKSRFSGKPEDFPEFEAAVYSWLLANNMSYLIDTAFMKAYLKGDIEGVERILEDSMIH